MTKFLPQNFNDVLAWYLLTLIVTLWVVQGCDYITLRDDVNGALVVLFTLVVQF